MYNAAGATLVAAFFLFRDPSTAARRLLPVVAIVVLFLLVVFPFLNDFTGGSLQERFEDTQTTHRSEIADADFQIFLENPVVGVGVGSSYEQRARYTGFKAMSHTEFARLLSEHGSFGIAAILALVAMSYANVTRQRSSFGRAFVAGLVFWCFFFALNAGMRLAAPSFLFGLTFINIPAGPGKRKLRSHSA
jgi:O-antigen ligase